MASSTVGLAVDDIAAEPDQQDILATQVQRHRVDLVPNPDLVEVAEVESIVIPTIITMNLDSPGKDEHE
jgi:hypothetical protein